MKKLWNKWTDIALVKRILVGLILGAILGIAVPGATGIAILGDVFVSALTKTSPRIAMPVAPGTAIPRIAPRISPTRIRFTRAMSVHLFQSFFIFLLL